MMRKEILTESDKTDENAFVLNIWTSDMQGKTGAGFHSRRRLHLRFRHDSSL